MNCELNLKGYREGRRGEKKGNERVVEEIIILSGMI